MTGQLRQTTINLSVKYMTSEAYHKIRNEVSRKINIAERLTFEQKLNVYPKYVYHKTGDNVVIRMPELENDKVISALTVNLNNTACFNYAQDHYPAMILMAAGKTNFIYRLPGGGDGSYFMSEIYLTPAAGQDSDF